MTLGPVNGCKLLLLLLLLQLFVVARLLLCCHSQLAFGERRVAVIDCNKLRREITYWKAQWHGKTGWHTHIHTHIYTDIHTQMLCHVVIWVAAKSKTNQNSRSIADQTKWKDSLSEKEYSRQKFYIFLFSHNIAMFVHMNIYILTILRTRTTTLEMNIYYYCAQLKFVWKYCHAYLRPHKSFESIKEV